MSRILTELKNIYVATRGFHTDRYLLVIESDDWGSIRMPSRETFLNLQRSGDHPENDGFLRNDCLETESDLKDLYEVLLSVCDIKGNPAVITANFAMANPDFDEIDISIGKYAFEPFYDTYRKYNKNSEVLRIVKAGKEKGIFFPQLHCREHLNVNRWMNALRNRQEDAILAFENKTMGVNSSFCASNVFGYMDAFNTDMTSLNELRAILHDAVDLFTQTFGYQSKTFVASCFVWPDEFEPILAEHGIIGIQSAAWQNCSVGVNGSYRLRRKIHYTGQTNKCDQSYTVRNCDYEPAYHQNPEECADACFNQICRSFRVRKPAIINSHRFNYISSINPNNAQRNLKGLRSLLIRVKKRFPEVEFITTVDLLNIIRGEKNDK